MHCSSCPSLYSSSPPRSAAPRFLALFLLLASFLSLAPTPSHASSVAAAARLTPRNFVPSLSAQGTLTVAYDLVNTGSATATSTRITSISLLSTTNVRVGTRLSPAALPAAVADIPAGGSKHLAVMFSGLTAGQRTKFSIAFSASGPIGASTGFYLTVPSAPVVPITLTATPGNGAVTLSYNAIPGAASYSIYESTDPNADPSTYTYLANTSGTTYTQTGLKNGTTYYYAVVPFDSSGTAGTPSNIASASVSLSAPTNLTATAGISAVTLSYTPPADQGVDYTNVYVSTTPNAALSDYTLLGNSPGAGPTTFLQGGLKNGTTYYFVVISHNAGGLGTPSKVVSALVSLPAPTNLTATPGNGSVTLNFTPPANQGVFQTNIYESTNSSAALSDYTLIGSTPGTTYTQTGLKNGTTYYYYVASQNAGDLGAPSKVVSATVSLPAPTNLAATPGTTSITLTFTASAGVGAADYEVFESTSPTAPSSSYVSLGKTSGKTTFTQTGLSPGTTYYYYVVPQNAGGPGTPSATVHATVPVPVSLSAPTSLSGTHGNGIIRLSWVAPTGAVAYYNVKRSTTSGGPYTTISAAKAVTGPTYDDTSVVNGTTYYYVVTAVATNGMESVPSNEAAVLAGFIGTGLVAAPGNGLVTLTFDSIIGATDYHVVVAADNYHFSDLGSTGGATSFTQTGLSNGQTYYYYVVPYNSGGAGGQSATVSALVSLPAPTGVTATPGDGSVTIRWKASAFPGASDYHVIFSTDDYHYSDLGSTGGKTSFTQTGLANATKYYYYVVPYNDGGAGTASATVSATVSLAAPSNVKATPGDGSVTVTWDAVATASDYHVVVAADNYHFSDLGTTSGKTSFTQTGLSNGQTYYYYVVAYNKGGASPNSATVSALVSLPAPTGVTATPGDGSVTVAWTASAFPGATDYHVVFSTDNYHFSDLGNTGGNLVHPDRSDQRPDLLLLRCALQQRRRGGPICHSLSFGIFARADRCDSNARQWVGNGGLEGQRLPRRN